MTLREAKQGVAYLTRTPRDCPVCLCRHLDPRVFRRRVRRRSHEDVLGPVLRLSCCNCGYGEDYEVATP